MTPDDTTPAEALRTKVAVALHDADCGDRTCNGSALGDYYRAADIAIEAAAPLIAARAAAAERERWAAPLADAVEGLHEMIGYVPDYFRDKWDHQGYIDRAEKALADLLAAQDTP